MFAVRARHEWAEIEQREHIIYVNTSLVSQNIIVNIHN